MGRSRRLGGSGFRLFRLVGLLVVVLLTACSSGAAKGSTTLRIGYQKFGILTLLKARGTLEKRLAAKGNKVEWTEFQAGPVLLEGIKTNSIDFGTTGEAPTIFALAAETPLTYVAADRGNPLGEAILVPANSTIKSVADLKGKKVALNKGSNVHFFLVRALEAAGLAYTDIQTVFLAPADARAAFTGGSVDAWVIWDPFLSVARHDLGAKAILDGTGLVSNRSFYLAHRDFARDHPDVIDDLLAEIQATETWAQANPAEAATIAAPIVGIDKSILAEVLGRQGYGAAKVTPEILADQQQVADVFFKLALIPRALVIADAQNVAAR